MARRLHITECKLRKMCLANDVKPVKLPGEASRNKTNLNHSSNVTVYKKYSKWPLLPNKQHKDS